jgi:outer membrane protein, adhesin transport system
MMNKIRKVLVFFMFFNPLGSTADTMTLPDALALSLRSHPAVAAKKNEYMASESALEGSLYQRFPSISAQSTAIPINGTPTRTNSVRLEQPLWTGGRVTSQIEAATARLGSAKSSLNEVERDMVIKTAVAFIEVIRTSLRLEVAEENIIEFKRLLELIERRSKSEVSSLSEVIVARARLQQAKSDKINLESSYENSKADLEQLTGKKIEQLVFPVPDLKLTGNLNDVLESAVAKSPSLKRADFDVQAAEAEVSLKEAALYPQISVRYEKFWGDLASRNTDLIYLAVAYQPGAGLSSFSAIDESRSKKLSSELSEESLKKELTDKVRVDWNKVRSSSQQIDVIKELVVAARDTYESSVRQYAVGRKNWVEVLNARKEYAAAKNSLIDEEWGGYLSKVKLDIACGCGPISPILDYQ